MSMNQQGMPQMPFFPFIIQQPQQQAPRPDVEVIPARIDKAMEFYMMVSHKTMTRAAINDTNIEQIPGQQLTDEERNAFASACNLLSRYFHGQIEPDLWERLRLEMVADQKNGSIPGRLMHCIACGNSPDKSKCSLCHGTGKLMITPVGGPDLPNQEDSEPNAE